MMARFRGADRGALVASTLPGRRDGRKPPDDARGDRPPRPRRPTPARLLLDYDRIGILLDGELHTVSAESLTEAPMDIYRTVRSTLRHVPPMGVITAVFIGGPVDGRADPTRRADPHRATP